MVGCRPGGPAGLRRPGGWPVPGRDGVVRSLSKRRSPTPALGVLDQPPDLSVAIPGLAGSVVHVSLAWPEFVAKANDCRLRHLSTALRAGQLLRALRAAASGG